MHLSGKRSQHLYCHHCCCCLDLVYFSCWTSKLLVWVSVKYCHQVHDQNLDPVDLTAGNIFYVLVASGLDLYNEISLFAGKRGTGTVFTGTPILLVWDTIRLDDGEDSTESRRFGFFGESDKSGNFANSA